ncbi:MAG: competence protein ComF [Rickettsiaceae bacterium]|jgi:ComF family protein|nr:competence protein ComF [Rickettsiaceae bacterium]
MITTIKPLFKSALDTIFPPQCMACRKFVQEKGGLCHSCWEAIDFISSPQCDKCGVPFELATHTELLCGKCISDAPKYYKARAVFLYDDSSSSIITRFKYGDQIHTSSSFAKWMVRVGQEVLKDADVVVPVPLHKRRLFSRRYNQSALLANSIGVEAGIDACNDMLLRVKNTKPQAGLTLNQRAVNVKGAFALNPKHKAKVIGKNVILVDDVITTGSTINACVNALLKAGAGQVSVLTLAMTVKG